MMFERLIANHFKEIAFLKMFSVYATRWRGIGNSFFLLKARFPPWFLCQRESISLQP